MICVKDIMYVGKDNPVVDEDSCFRDVLETMDIRSIGATNVTDAENRLVGIITDGDLRRLMLRTQDTLPELFMKNVKTIMTRKSVTIDPDATLDDCFRIFKKHRFWVIPVVDAEKKLLGIVHLHSLLEAMEIK